MLAHVTPSSHVQSCVRGLLLSLPARPESCQGEVHCFPSASKTMNEHTIEERAGNLRLGGEEWSRSAVIAK